MSGIVVTGCPRSGTLYTAKLLQAVGFDVRHEALGKDGIVSWYVVPNSPDPPREEV